MKYWYILILLLLVLLSSCDSKKKKDKKQNEQSSTDLCSYCQHKFTNFIQHVRNGLKTKQLRKELSFFCTILSYTDKYECTDLIKRIFPIVKFIIENNPNLTPNEICAIKLQSKQCEKNYFKKVWNVKIHSGGPKQIAPKTYIPKKNNNNLNILQITDFHFDPKYLIGSEVHCSEKVCCRKFNSSVPIAKRAGRWGGYHRCDTPLATVKHALQHILKTHKKIDIIYVTGDYSDHAGYESSWPRNFYATTTIFNYLLRAFPHIPMYPLLGNHEPYPADEIAPINIRFSNMTTQPLYDFLYKKWNWLPENARNTLKSGGYYTILIRPGLRLIAINNIICMTSNWWLLDKSDYFIELLQWLENRLFDAEQNGEKVHLLAHIPWNHKHCYEECSNQFRRIVERYYQTLSAQFNGHTHRDEFNLFFSEKSPYTPINVAWNGGGITTWKYVNSNYRMYSVEPETYQVTNIETWIFNLTEANANKNNVPQWFPEYRFREEYQLADLSPASIFNFIHKMATNETTLNKYFRNFYKQSDYVLQLGCDLNCYRSLVCSMVTMVFPKNHRLCPYFSKIMDAKFKNTKKNTINKKPYHNVKLHVQHEQIFSNEIKKHTKHNKKHVK